MTKLIIESDNEWLKRKLQEIVQEEAEVLETVVAKTQRKLHAFEQKYGTTQREGLYGRVDDMELVEWEGEVETLEQLQDQLNSLKEIAFEYHTVCDAA